MPDSLDSLTAALAARYRVDRELGRGGMATVYQHYLALRSKPEPELMPEVERVRAELARLMSEHGR